MTRKYPARHLAAPADPARPTLDVLAALDALEAQARKAQARGRRYNARRADKTARFLAALAR